jgi:hypothetical protein
MRGMSFSDAVVIMMLNNAQAVGWICLVVGIALIGAGTYVGITAPATASTKETPATKGGTFADRAQQATTTPDPRHDQYGGRARG